MHDESQSRQLELFPGERVPWEALTEECRQSVRQLLSLLLEQVHQQLQQPSESNRSFAEEDQHV